MSKKASSEDKISFDVKNQNLFDTLKKHMSDWFEAHQTEKFITPKDFQNIYPMFDKFDSLSFRKGFYKAKNRIQAGECGSVFHFHDLVATSLFTDLFFYLVLLEAGIVESNQDEIDEIPPSTFKKVKKNTIAQHGPSANANNNQESTSLDVSIPHLVLKIDFHETEEDENGFWNGSASEIMDHLWEQSEKESNAKSNVTQKKKDSKVIVVIEMPNGGKVTHFNVGNTDDTLDVQIQKHPLMLNPKALLFSGIITGTLDASTDGPNTAQGGIRLNELAKALNAYRKKREQKTVQNKNGESDDMFLTFKLPDYVKRDSVKNYSYCFESSSRGNELPYAVTYFEFDVKDPKENEEKEEKKKAASMVFFSQNSNMNQKSNNSATNSNAGDRNSGFSSKPAGGQNHTSSSSAGPSCAQQPPNSTCDNDEDHEMMEEKSTAENSKSSHESTVYTKNYVNELKQDLEEEMNSKLNFCKTEYSKKLRENIEKIKEHKKKAKQNSDHFKLRLNEKENIIEKQNSRLDRQKNELKEILRSFNLKSRTLQEELNKMRMEHQKAQEQVRFFQDQAELAKNAIIAKKAMTKLQDLFKSIHLLTSSLTKIAQPHLQRGFVEILTVQQE